MARFRFLTLRGLIGGVCAVCVIIVAAITLAITYTVSIATVRDVGKNYASALATLARVETESFFNEAVGAATNMALMYKQRDWNTPQLDPDYPNLSMHDKYWHMHYPYITNSNYTIVLSGIAYSADGSAHSAVYDGTIVAFHSRVLLSPGVMQLKLYAVNVTNGGYDYADPREVISDTDIGDVNLDGRSPIFYTALTLMGTNRKGGWLPTQMYIAKPSAPPYFVLPLVMPIYNWTNKLIGLGAVSQTIGTVNDLMRSTARATAHTEAFAIETSGLILGSSHKTPAFYVYETNQTNPTVPFGCCTSGDSSFQAAYVAVGCRTAATAFTAYPPLASLADSQPEFLTSATPTVEEFQVGGDNYFAVSTAVNNEFRFWGLNIVLIMPEADIIGDIVTGRNTAIGITAAVCVVAAVFSFMLVFVLLQPLTTMSKKMLDTAKLRETEEEKEFSHLAEIQDLQRAYANMNTAIKSFTRYVPRDVVKDLMSTGQLCEINMVPQRCTMLFVDIAGFTTVCERVPPDVLSGLVSQYFDRASRIVMDHDGLIDKFIGDCIMAVWGAPFATPNQEVKATLTGKLLDRETVVDPLARAWDEAGEQLRIRVGISTGEVLAGNMGSAERMNYTVIGDPVNLAARLESMNRQFGTRVMVSEMTAEGLGNVFVLRLLLPIAVVGKEQPVKVYEVMGLPQQFDTVDLDHLEDIDHTFTRIAEAESVHSFDSHFSQNARQQREPRSTITMLREAQSNTAAAQPLTCSTDVEELAKKQTLAVVAYLNRDFNGALLLLAKLRNQLPASIISGRDGTTDKSMGIVERLCQDYLQSCPEDFDGVYRALEK